MKMLTFSYKIKKKRSFCIRFSSYYNMIYILQSNWFLISLMKYKDYYENGELSDRIGLKIKMTSPSKNKFIFLFI